jgi:hypothetical protein
LVSAHCPVVAWLPIIPPYSWRAYLHTKVHMLGFQHWPPPVQDQAQRRKPMSRDDVQATHAHVHVLGIPIPRESQRVELEDIVLRARFLRFCGAHTKDPELRATPRASSYKEVSQKEEPTRVNATGEDRLLPQGNDKDSSASKQRGGGVDRQQRGVQAEQRCVRVFMESPRVLGGCHHSKSLLPPVAYVWFAYKMSRKFCTSARWVSLAVSANPLASPMTSGLGPGDGGACSNATSSVRGGESDDGGAVVCTVELKRT